jgi:Cu/Ag efflux protein CusF
MKTKTDLSMVKDVFDSSDITVLFPDLTSETNKKIVYRKNGKSIDKIVEYDTETGSKVKTTHYDYFDDKKIRSIDEFDKESGKKVRTINYVLYKSIDEYDLETGKKIRTINFNVKDETKISSIQEYDTETGKIITVSIYKRDGQTISIVKHIDPTTEKVTNWINNNSINAVFKEPLKYATRSYDNIKMKSNEEKEDIAKLIDNLYCNIF